MSGRKVGGRIYSDPDIVSLIEASGGLLDPYSAIQQQVNSLLDQLESFEVKWEDAFQRISVLASLAGLEVKPMNTAQAAREEHDALLMYTNGNGKKGVIFFNPDKPRPRVVFSIGHEIIHSFFPTSRTGARFRALCKEGTKESRELEMLCHLGASELTMPEEDFKKTVRRFGFGLGSVDSIRREFGTSFEASLYRMAETAPFPAAAGLLRFRWRLKEESQILNCSATLFPRGDQESATPAKKYRRHSFYHSESFPRDLVIPWNKSFPETSCVYQAAKTQQIVRADEVIPLNGRGKILPCFMEAVVAPYQPADSDPAWPDIFFLLRADAR